MYLVDSFSSLVASDVCFAPPDFECDFWVGLISWALLPRQLRQLIYAGVSWQEYVQHTDGGLWTLFENSPEGRTAEFLDRKNREWGHHVTSSFSGSFKVGHRTLLTSIQIIVDFVFFLEMMKDLFLFCFLVSALAAYVSKISKYSANICFYKPTIMFIGQRTKWNQTPTQKIFPRRIKFKMQAMSNMHAGNLIQRAFRESIKCYQVCR